MANSNKRAFLYYEEVSLWYLRYIGWLLGGKIPVHCRIYFTDGDKRYITELTSDKPTSPEQVVGKGEGYTIQIREVETIRGIPLDGCNVDLLIEKAKIYANCDNGTLSTEERDWYYEPQGHGGPMYDRPTSNTYVSWLISKTCKINPSKPKGAIGWDIVPKFPGKKPD
jgi:hypothetical protein